VPKRPNPLSAVSSPFRLAKPQRSVLASVQDVPGIGHNGGPALSDADLISEVLARGLQPAVADERIEPLLLTIPEVCAAASISRTVCYDLMNARELPAVKRGRSTLVFATDLHEWMAKLPSYRPKSDKPNSDRQ
jgi:excisionase family DNA binding protein